MRTGAAQMVTAVMITATCTFGADSSLGIWKLNVAKSKSTSTNPITSRIEVVESMPDGTLQRTSTRQLKDGTAAKFSFRFKYDGKEYPVRGAAYDTFSARRLNANTTSFEEHKSGGKLHFTGQTVISTDGKTSTLTAKGTDEAGRPVVATLIFDKQ